VLGRQLANEQYDQIMNAVNILSLVPNMTVGFGNVGGGSTKIENALKQTQEWLGPNYKEIAPGVYRSAERTTTSPDDRFKIQGSKHCTCAL
jgi:hypothetical protein